MSAQIFIHASEILTGSGVRAKDGRHIKEEDLGRVEDGAVVYSTKKIEWVGKTRDLPKKYLKLKKKNLAQKQAIVPGFVDCHTHLVFSGNRAQEFAERCAGVSYQEIARKGGGILTTVNATRAASLDELEALAIARVKESMRFGVRTLEIKSGYGLSNESEIKILKVVRRLKRKFPEIKFHSTFMGAHAFPNDRTRDQYLDDLIQMLKQVSKGKLAESCDIFIDEGYFTTAEASHHLSQARKLGFKIKIHADELKNTESAVLAEKFGALSADHLLKISELGIKALSKPRAPVAVLLPGTAFYLKTAQAPARKLLDAGACVALSTDFNPGTCMTLSLPLIMTLAALELGMTRAEVFAAVTYNASKALGFESTQGTIEPGMRADFLVLPFLKFEEVYYRFGWSGL